MSHLRSQAQIDDDRGRNDVRGMRNLPMPPKESTVKPPDPVTGQTRHGREFLKRAGQPRRGGWTVLPGQADCLLSAGLALVGVSPGHPSGDNWHHAVRVRGWLCVGTTWGDLGMWAPATGLRSADSNSRLRRDQERRRGRRREFTVACGWARHQLRRALVAAALQPSGNRPESWKPGTSEISRPRIQQD